MHTKHTSRDILIARLMSIHGTNNPGELVTQLRDHGLIPENAMSN